MSEKRGKLLLGKQPQLPAQVVRSMLFGCNRRKLLIQCLIWREEELPSPQVIDECMVEIEKGSTPPLYQRFLEIIRPAVLIVNNDPLPVRDEEILQDADRAIRQLRRVF